MTGHESFAMQEGYADHHFGADAKRCRCLVVVGTRQEAISLFPVIQAMQRSADVEPFVVVTGSQTELVEPVLEMAGIEPDADLRAATPGRSVNRLLAGVVSRFDDLLTELRGGPERRSRPRLFGIGGVRCRPYPAATLVHGSTTSALAAALASAGAMIPVIHIEADGPAAHPSLPSTGDFNGRMLTRLAAFHVTATSDRLSRMVSDGIPADRIFVAGNTSVDAFRWAADLQVPWPEPHLAVLDDPDRPVVLAVVRHPENGSADQANGLRKVASGIAQIAVNPEILVVVPMHPDPAVRACMMPTLTGLRNVIMTEPLPYPAFARLVQRSTVAITDSMSLQAEAPAVGTPTLVTSDATHRRAGSEAGTLRFVGAQPDVIADTTLRLLAGGLPYERMLRSVNPFGDGLAGERIAAALEHLIFDTPPPAPFGSSFSRHQILASAGYTDADIRAADSLTHSTSVLTSIERSRNEDVLS